MRKTEKEDNSVMDFENFVKSKSGPLHLRHNLGFKLHDPISRGSYDILFTSFHMLTMRKTEKGDNSVMGFREFYQKLVRSSTP